MFIKSVLQALLVLKNQLLDAPKVMRFDAPVASQTDRWFEPELAFTLGAANVDVSWLLSFIGIEVKPE